MSPLDPTVPKGSTPDGSGGHLGPSVGPQGSPSAFVALGGQGSGGSLVTTPISLGPGFNLDLSSDKVDGPPVLGDRLGFVAIPCPTVVGCGEAPAFKVAGCLPSFPS